MNLLVNKHVHRNYEIIKSLEAGIQLSGNEVKSLRNKQGSLKEAYVTIRDNATLLVSAHIPPYQHQNSNESYDPYRERTILVHKKEQESLRSMIKQKGLTLVPLRIYAAKRFIKIELGVGKGKRNYDKRQDLRDRSNKREVERAMKEQY
jgi:SsrA-binding protein